jgi:hypothetical protein
MTRQEALEIARQKYVSNGWMSVPEADRITKIKKVRRWPLIGPINTWRTCELLGDSNKFGIVEVNNATCEATSRTRLRKNPF